MHLVITNQPTDKVAMAEAINEAAQRVDHRAADVRHVVDVLAAVGERVLEKILDDVQTSARYGNSSVRPPGINQRLQKLLRPKVVAEVAIRNLDHLIDQVAVRGAKGPRAGRRI